MATKKQTSKKSKVESTTKAKKPNVPQTKQTTMVPLKPSIVDIKNYGNHGITIFPQPALQEIFKQSGSLAVSNEFQIHYWALNYQYTAVDGSILIVSLPTVFFNYKQEVSSAAIDFQMTDVATVSEKLLPVHNMVVNKLKVLKVKEQLEKMFQVKFQEKSVPLNSIHRHPGSSSYQSFSATDYCKTPDDHGIVYPLKKANKQVNFASIMAIDNDKCNLAHTEFRIATGTLGKDITYEQGRCLAIMWNEPEKRSMVESLFITETPVKHVIKTVESLIPDTLVESLTNYIMDIQKTVPPLTKFVSDKNLTRKAYVYDNYYNNTNTYGYGTYGNYTYSYGYEDDYEFGIKAPKYKNYTKSNISKASYTELLTYLRSIDEFFDTYRSYKGYSLEALQTEVLEANAEFAEALVEEGLEQLEELEELEQLEELEKKPDPEITEYKTKLQKQGIDKHILNQVSTSTIKRWYDEMFK